MPKFSAQANSVLEENSVAQPSYVAHANLGTCHPAQPKSNLSGLSQPNINITFCPYQDHGSTQHSEKIKYTCNTSTKLETPNSHIKSTRFSVPSFQDKLLNRSTILVKLAALQSRCTALQNALMGITASSSSCLHGCDQVCSYSTTDPSDIVSKTKICAPPSSHFDVDQVAGTINWKFPDPTGQPSSSFDMAYPGLYLLDQDLLREDYAASNEVACEISDSEFQKYFDLSAASLLAPNAETISNFPTSPVLKSNSDSTYQPSDISRVQDTTFIIAPAANTIQPRFHCQDCMMTFRRRSDRDRHALVHNPNAPRFPCTYPRCTRVGRRGFLRKDKLTQHQIHMNH